MPAARTAFRLLIATYVVTWAWQAAALPDRVPAHYDLAGRADRWGSRTEHLVQMGLLGLLVAGGFELLARGLARLPSTAINVPNAAYWRRPEHRGGLVRMLTGDLYLIGAATLALLVVLQVATAVGGDDPGPVLDLAVACYVTSVLGWAVRAHLGPRYRVPAR